MKSKWINIKDKIPEPQIDVLVAYHEILDDEQWEYEVAFFFDGDWFSYKSQGYSEMKYYPEFWSYIEKPN